MGSDCGRDWGHFDRTSQAAVLIGISQTPVSRIRSVALVIQNMHRTTPVLVQLGTFARQGVGEQTEALP